jgi:hypothetical protein
MAVTWGIFAQSTATVPKDAPGFYVANAVLADGAKQPRAQSLTIFAANKVYDVSLAGSQIVIFDAKEELVVLLDKQRKTKTEIGLADLEAAREQLREWCLKQADPVLRFCGRPKFKLQSAENRLAFLADEIEYLVDTADGGQGEAAAEYREFSDAMVGLAVVAQSSPIPPLARLIVNRELEKNGVLPVSVSVKLQPRGAGEHALHFRTHHTIGWQLRAQDQQLVRDANAYERDFRRVSVDEFFGRGESALSAR